jgi:hypothetical protein
MRSVLMATSWKNAGTVVKPATASNRRSAPSGGRVSARAVVIRPHAPVVAAQSTISGEAATAMPGGTATHVARNGTLSAGSTNTPPSVSTMPATQLTHANVTTRSRGRPMSWWAKATNPEVAPPMA